MVNTPLVHFNFNVFFLSGAGGGGGGGWAVIRGCALIRGWALNRINMVNGI